MSHEPTPAQPIHAEARHEHDPAKDIKTYLATIGALLLLTIITVGASYIHFESGAVNIVIALTIATMKASLVALFFMHLAHDRPINAVVLIAGFVFLGLLLLFTMTDIGTREAIQPKSLTVPTAPATPAAAAPAPGAPAPNPAGH